MCTCDDLITNSGLRVDSLDNNAAPAGASVVINDELRLGPDASIDGSLYVTGKYGATTAPRVSGAFVQGAAPRCGCNPEQLLDIAALARARVRDNDDAGAQLTAASLNGFSAGRRLSLDCGRYYFDRIAGGGELQIEARGRIAVFVAGDLALDDGFSLTLQNGAKLVVLDANRRTLQELELPRRAADLTLDVEGRHAVVSFDGRQGITNSNHCAFVVRLQKYIRKACDRAQSKSDWAGAAPRTEAVVEASTIAHQEGPAPPPERRTG